MAQTLHLATTYKARFHAGTRRMADGGLRTYIAFKIENGSHVPVAEVLAANEREAKRLLVDALAEQFAPRYEHGGYEPRFFKVVWC